MSLRKTPGWEQRIDLRGAGGEEVSEKTHPCVTDGKMDRDRQESEEGRTRDVREANKGSKQGGWSP